MFCVKCGGELSQGAKFCKHCGSAVRQKSGEKHRQLNRPRAVIIVTAIIAIVLVGLGFGIFFDSENMASRDAEEIFHFVYRSDVMVIEQPPIYSFVEVDGAVIITVYNPNDEIRQLTIGDTFVLEAASHNPGGMSGHITNIAEQGAELVITARLPESLDEIFYEFELADTLDVLSLVDEITLSDELYGVEGIELTRNRTSNVTLWARRANIGGVILDGELSVQRPVIRRSISLCQVNYLIVEAGVELNLEATASGNFDRVITLFTIPVRIIGTGLDVPVGIRISAGGEVSLELELGVNAEFGIRNNQFIADLEPEFSFEFEFNGRAAISKREQGFCGLLCMGCRLILEKASKATAKCRADALKEPALWSRLSM